MSFPQQTGVTPVEQTDARIATGVEVAAGPDLVNDRLAQRRRLQRLSAFILLVYVAAFALPVFNDTGMLGNHLGIRPRGPVYGWQAFLVGWVAQQYGGWFANIALWLGVFFLAINRRPAGGVAGLVAVALGSTYLGLVSEQSMIYPPAYGIGFYCWMASPVILVGATLALSLFGPGWRSIIFTSVATVVVLAAMVSIERRVVAATAPPSDMVLINELRHGNLDARRGAAKKLGLRHKPEFIPALIEAIGDPDDKVRQNAISAIGKMGPAGEVAVPVLIDVLSSRPDSRQAESADAKLTANSRSAAASALGSIGPPAKAAIPALTDSLKDENVAVRRWAATSLGEMGREARSAVPALLAELGDSDPQARRDAIRSLQKIGAGADVIPVISKAAQDKDQTVRETAAAILKQMPKAP